MSNSRKSPIKSNKKLKTGSFFQSARQVTLLQALNASLLVATIGVLFLYFGKAAPAPGFYGSVEADQAARINDYRANLGLAGLSHIECLNSIAEQHTQEIMDAGYLYHTPDLGSRLDANCGGFWNILGENVGTGNDSAELFGAFINSPGHRANIVSTKYSRMGTGAAYSADGRLWVTQVFANCSDCGGGWGIAASVAADPTVRPPTELSNYLRNSNSNGPADAANFKYGLSTYTSLYCDWDGNGTDTVGVYDNGTWYLRYSNSAGSANVSFKYGIAGYIPVCGDWNGDGTDTVGVIIPGSNNTMRWLLRNANSAGSANYDFAYGLWGQYKPVVGDWNGDKIDSAGVTLPGANNVMRWLLKDSNSAGSANYDFAYGLWGQYKPVVGDWNGDGKTTPGVVLPNGDGSMKWLLRNTNSGGGADTTISSYGLFNPYTPVTGDWNGDKVDTIGVVAP